MTPSWDRSRSGGPGSDPAAEAQHEEMLLDVASQDLRAERSDRTAQRTRVFETVAESSDGVTAKAVARRIGPVLIADRSVTRMGHAEPTTSAEPEPMFLQGSYDPPKNDAEHALRRLLAGRGIVAQFRDSRRAPVRALKRMMIGETTSRGHPRRRPNETGPPGRASSRPRSASGDLNVPRT